MHFAAIADDTPLGRRKFGDPTHHLGNEGQCRRLTLHHRRYVDAESLLRRWMQDADFHAYPVGCVFGVEVY